MDNKRTCGECTACCMTHGVFELKKPPGEYCSHCEIGRGCKIYANRPLACQKFNCEWLLGLGLSESRPDKTQIVPELRELEDFGVVLFLWEAGGGMLKLEFSKLQTRVSLMSGTPVMHIPVFGKPKLYLPKGMMDLGFAFRFCDFPQSETDVEVEEFLEGRF